MISASVSLGDLQDQLAIRFADEALLRLAVTHSSYANEHPEEPGTNERLEFLGDAVLGLVVAERLYQRFPRRAGGPAHAVARAPRAGLDAGAHRGAPRARTGAAARTRRRHDRRSRARGQPRARLRGRGRRDYARSRPRRRAGGRAALHRAHAATRAGRAAGRPGRAQLEGRAAAACRGRLRTPALHHDRGARARARARVQRRGADRATRCSGGAAAAASSRRRRWRRARQCDASVRASMGSRAGNQQQRVAG